MERHHLFEDALNIAIEVIHKSETKEEMLDKLFNLLEAHRERSFIDRLNKIKCELGIWKIP